MKKTYIKPIASKIAIAVNENIAASLTYGSGHLGFVNDLMIDDGSCNKYLANTFIESNITGPVETFEDLVNVLMNLGGDELTEPERNKIIEDLIVSVESGTFGCWKN